MSPAKNMAMINVVTVILNANVAYWCMTKKKRYVDFSLEHFLFLYPQLLYLTAS